MDVILICCRWTNQINMTCFTVNKFEDDIPVVLDTSLKRTSIDVYRKHTNTGQYVLFVSHELRPREIAWVRVLLHRFLISVISWLVLQTRQQRNYQMQNRAQHSTVMQWQMQVKFGTQLKLLNPWVATKFQERCPFTVRVSFPQYCGVY